MFFTVLRECHEKSGIDPIFVDSYDTGVKLLNNKTCKYMLASLSSGMDMAEGAFCGRMILTGEPLSRGGSSFLLPRGSRLTRIMSIATLNMQTSGRISSLEEYYKEKHRQCESNIHSSLTLPKLKIFFISAFSACFLIFLGMVLYPQQAITETTPTTEASPSSAEHVSPV